MYLKCDSKLMTFYQNPNPTNNLDASAQNIDQIHMRTAAAIFNGHHIIETDCENSVLTTVLKF